VGDGGGGKFVIRQLAEAGGARIEREYIYLLCGSIEECGYE